MSDNSTTIQQLRDVVDEFVSQRDWEQFHAPKNISMALAIEAAELMEHFQWLTVSASREVADDEKKRDAVAEELADVVCYALALANEMRIDISDSLAAKMVKNREKYPADEFRGRYGPEDESPSS
ncbi:MAG: nucleotide pyrophosphohydrolase [Pirellulaceae bacterium]|nr:nucleotide pyrophosphohydrolase [Pirellulaceae bacterium]MDP7016443.1 nucleotide pyrophosphohydrolase [Pirellulaceae bacterium]